ncbi:MAG TPA: type II CAAX endopeptidase family protein [Actinomycetota bacterium]
MQPTPPPPRPDFVPSPAASAGASWRPLEALPVFFIAIIFTGVVHLLLAQIPGFCGGQAVIEALLGEIAFGAAVIFWIRYINRGSLRALGVPATPWRDIGIGIAAGGVLIVAGALTLVLVRELVTLISGKTPAQPEQLVSCVRGTALAFMGPVVVLVAPAGEETFFRGFLYKGLRRRMPVWGAALLSGAIFGAVHVYPLLIPALFVVGVGLALLYERRQSLLAPMAAHATFNVVGFLMIVLSRTAS